MSKTNDKKKHSHHLNWENFNIKSEDWMLK
jgi:hypothetical protein